MQLVGIGDPSAQRILQEVFPLASLESDFSPNMVEHWNTVKIETSFSPRGNGCKL